MLAWKCYKTVSNNEKGKNWCVTHMQQMPAVKQIYVRVCTHTTCVSLVTMFLLQYTIFSTKNSAYGHDINKNLGCNLRLWEKFHGY